MSVKPSHYDCSQQKNAFSILGDSAYPISPQLMKPYFRPEDPQKRRFNHKLSAIRTICTENVIGLWKRRFPCLRMGIRTKLSTACDIVVATAVLHNLALLWGEPEPDDVGFEDEDNLDNFQPPNRTATAIRVAGQLKRDWLAMNFC
jgi:hypothetical protein